MPHEEIYDRGQRGRAGDQINSTPRASMANRSKNSEKIKSVVNPAREKTYHRMLAVPVFPWAEQTEMIVGQPKRSSKLLN
jgi:hypothetical protein